MLRGLHGKGFEFGCIALAVSLYRGGNVLVPKVQHRERKTLLVAGDGAGDVRPAQRQPPAPRGVDVIGDAPHVVTKQVGLLGKRREDGTDGIVRRHLFQPQLHGGHALLVDLGAIAGARHVGLCLCEPRQKRGLQSFGLLPENLLRQLQHPRRIRDDLHRLDARQIVEEPPAAGVHQLRVPLHLHQLQGPHPLLFRQNFPFMRAEEPLLRLRAPVQHHFDVPVAGSPHVFEELAALLFRQRDHGVAQLVQRLPQRRPPGLVEPRRAPVAAAVRSPPLHPVYATP